MTSTNDEKHEFVPDEISPYLCRQLTKSGMAGARCFQPANAAIHGVVGEAKHDHRTEFADCPACQKLGRIEEDVSVLPATEPPAAIEAGDAPPERLWIEKTLTYSLARKRGTKTAYLEPLSHGEHLEYILRSLHNAQVARLREALRGLPDLVPTSWLDSLLTGPDAVVGKPPYSGSDIETLLRAIKKRIADAAARSALASQEREE